MKPPLVFVLSDVGPSGTTLGETNALVRLPAAHRVIVALSGSEDSALCHVEIHLLGAIQRSIRLQGLGKSESLFWRLEKSTSWWRSV